MSMRYEWYEPKHTGVWWLPNGTDVRDGSPADEHTTDEHIVDQGGALILGADEGVVLHGTPGEVYDLLDRAIRALPWRYELKDAYGQGWGIFDTRGEAAQEAIRLDLSTFTVEETLVQPEPDDEDANEPSLDVLNEGYRTK